MKLATLNDGSRDGSLVVVSRDLTRAVSAADIAPCLREALEGWAEISPSLEERSQKLESGSAAGAFAFDSAATAAPLPRAPQFLDGSAFLSHGKRMVQAFKLSTASLEVKHPLMYQGTSDAFLGAQAAMPVPDEGFGIDIEAEMGIFTDYVPMGVASGQAGKYVRLLALFDDVSLRRLQPEEMSLGFGMIHSKPTSVFSPVAVTPDELGDAWQDGRVHLRMRITINGKQLGELETNEMDYTFHDLIAYAAKTRILSPGTIIGSGTVSNQDFSRGTGCITERRALDTLEQRTALTEWLRFGDRVRIEAFDQSGRSVFGAIDHTFISSAGS